MKTGKQRLRVVLSLAFLGCLGTAQAQSTPAQEAAWIDKRLQTEWSKAHIVPAAPVDDARFLRRAYLQIVGTIPPAQVVTEFVADRSPDKRARAVEALLDSPKYAEHWTEYWDSVLMGKRSFSPVVDRQAFRKWLHGQIDKNVPYNQFVTNLITATGQNSTGPTYAEANGLGMLRTGGARMQSASVDDSKINGAVNWHLKFLQTPADLSGTASKVFLGVQIQCAQCHDHKTEKWKQEDFRRFTACFTQAAPLPVGGAQMQAKNAGANIREVILRDVAFPIRANRLNGGEDRAPYLNAFPAMLDGTPLSGGPANRRRELAVWMTGKDNPWFAQAIVNRMWAKFMGRGFVEPIDDFRPSNPAMLPDVLKQIADDFAAHDYDMKYLIKTITATQVYQLASVPAGKSDPENRMWDHFRLTPMGTDELLNSLVDATNFQSVLARLPGGNLGQIKARLQRQLTFLFDTDEEDMEQKEFEGTIPQTLLLLNGSLTNTGVTPIPGTALAEVMAMPGGDAPKIEALYLRTLSRKPTAAELKKWTDYVNAPRAVILTWPTNQLPPPRPMLRTGQAGAGQGPGARAGIDPLARLNNRSGSSGITPKQQAYEDLFWALLNSSEFVFNH